MSHPRALRALAVTVLAALGLLLGAGTALAHTAFLDSDPADGSTLGTAPDQVTLRFNENIPAEFAAITVLGPDGGQYQTGAVTAGEGTLTTAVALGAPGRYEIGFRVVSDDGHPVTGSTAFTLTAPGPAAVTPTAAPTTAEAAPEPAATPPSAAAEDTGTPVWPWILGAVLVVGGGVAAALRLGRG